MAGAGRDQARHHHHQGALAAAGRPNDRNEFSCADIERNVLHRLERGAPARRKDLVDALNPNEWIDGRRGFVRAQHGLFQEFLGHHRTGDLPPVLDDVPPQRLQPDRLMHRRGAHNDEVGAHTGRDPVILDARRLRRVARDHVDRLLQFVRQRELRHMGDHGDAFQRIGLAEGIVGIVHIVLRGDDVGAARQELLDARDAAPLGLAVKPRRADQVDMRVAGNGDARRRDHVDDLGRIYIVVGGERAAMACGDAAVKPLAHSLHREILQAARVLVVGVVDEHVDVAVVPFGDLEADIDVLARVGISIFVPRQATDDVAALLHRLLEQIRCAGVTHDALLREGNHFDVTIVAELFARQEQALRGPQSADGADVGKQPEERRAILHAGFEHPHRSLRNLGGIVVALELIGDLDRLRQRAGDVGAHDRAQERLVGMEVQVEHARQDEASGRVNLARALRAHLGLDGNDAILGDRDIGQSRLTAKLGVANDDIYHGTCLITARCWRAFRSAPGCGARVSDRSDKSIHSGRNRRRCFGRARRPQAAAA